jgi:hypothetical protein
MKIEVYIDDMNIDELLMLSNLVHDSDNLSLILTRAEKLDFLSLDYIDEICYLRKRASKLK